MSFFLHSSKVKLGLKILTKSKDKERCLSKSIFSIEDECPGNHYIYKNEFAQE